MIGRPVHHGSCTLGIVQYVSGRRYPRRGFALLLLAVGQHVLWQNRSASVLQQRCTRAMWSLLFRLQRSLYRYLDRERFWLGEQEFLSQRSLLYVRLANGRILHSFTPLPLVWYDLLIGHLSWTFLLYFSRVSFLTQSVVFVRYFPVRGKILFSVTV